MEKGADYHYTRPQGPHGGCKNVHEGKPSCLIGTIFVKLGIPVSWFGRSRAVFGGDLVGASADSVLDAAIGEGLIECDTNEAVVRNYLGQMQAHQDRLGMDTDVVTSMHSWGSCLEAGDTYLRARGRL
ncbi:MAG: hypothetical protein GWO24_35170 [Akkermansiaceae bacterium]|nr:hypothetical protein [Akkermansiaceae bacterium]